MTGTPEMRPIPMDRVSPDPDQPRKIFDADRLQELAISIRENGLLQPITVVSHGRGRNIGYTIIAGERRFRAHQILKAETILARVVKIDGPSVRVAQIVENAQRADITPLEEATPTGNFSMRPVGRSNTPQPNLA